MTQFKDYFSSDPGNYKQFRPTYPQSLYDHLAAISPSTQRAWDVGCGNGQAAVELSKRFQQVDASDASEKQIAEAQTQINLNYHVSPAERIPAADHSLDLITVAQAIHWFNHELFFKEVDRALKPNGILAVWGYQLLYTNSKLDGLVEEFHSKTVGPYWPAERALLDNSYSKIQFPYSMQSAPQFQMQAQWQFSHLIGYLNTWSAVKQFEKHKGFNPVEAELQRFKDAWGDCESSNAVFWPLILYIGKKSV